MQIKIPIAAEVADVCLQQDNDTLDRLITV